MYGVQTSYRDSRGRWRESPTESVVKVLRALGAALGDPPAGDDASRCLTSPQMAVAIRERKRELWNRVVEPVLVAWDGVLPAVTVRLPVAAPRSEQAGEASERSERRSGAWSRSGLKLTLTLEEGAEEQWEVAWDSLELVEANAVSGERFEARRVLFARVGFPGAGSTSAGLIGIRRGRLPPGYHRLRVEAGGAVAETVVISAPRRCWAPQQVPKPGRAWGVFAPLYALRSERNWGAGDLADLGKLRDWVADEGGSVVATLPLLASYLDHPFEPAPYRPVSRLFWNELYLAVDQIAEWDRCPAARELWNSDEVQNRVRALRDEPLVDYEAVMALKRRVLEELSRCFFAQTDVASAAGGDAERRKALSAYVRAHPEAEEYAAFRARVEATGADWRSWPDAPPTGRAGERSPTDRAGGQPLGGAAEATRYHLYCQWQMDEQLGRLSRPGTPGASDGAGAGPDGSRLGPGQSLPGLFLDLPLGVHPGGLDAWRWRGLFATGVSTGAPPDSFFALGQDWESPPLHPERIREQGHEYFARCVRHHMRHARYLRIDHVMALHRLFWVPGGTEPTDGVYVTYPADEMYAVLCLESHRNRTVVVGEDLGTVPAGVRSSMRRHGVLGTWVLQASLRPRTAAPVGAVPRHTVASLNTHDMFPFAGFVAGADVGARVVTGQLAAPLPEKERRRRAQLLSRLAGYLRGLGLLSPGDHADVVAWLAAHLGAAWRGAGPKTRGAGNAGTKDALGAGAGHVSARDAASLEAPIAPAAAPAALLGALLTYLAQSRAELVLLTLEDVWLETRPQNQPGTGSECPNWCGKAALSLDDLDKLGQLRAVVGPFGAAAPK